MGQSSRFRCATLAAVISAAVTASPALATKLTLKDGRLVEGRVGMVAGVAESPDATTNQTGGVDVQSIMIVDDGLRRTFVSSRRVREVNEQGTSTPETIKIPQRVPDSGSRIASVGPILRIDPFDEYGRRIFSMKTASDPLHVVQGITEITPVYTKVEAIQGHRAYLWEMRIATSSIPRETLSKILSHYIDQTKPNERLKIVRLYVESERYSDARAELEAIVAAFPDLAELKAEVSAIRQMGARMLLDEIEMRSKAGQHQFVLALVEHFPAEGVAGETLQRVREIQARYQAQHDQGDQALKLVDEHLAKIENKDLRYRLEKVRDELRRELNLTTLDRMAAYLRLADDATLSPEQKLSLAASGWLLGSSEATVNLPSTLALWDVRELVVQYLRETLKQRRDRLLEQLKTQEGASPKQIATLIARMKPPLETDPGREETSGYYELEVPSLEGEPDVTYYLQLPPEYDPYRSYPLVVTLNGTGTTPEQQLEWWAGARGETGQRTGQASRHGYAVLSIDWQKPHQGRYEYSAREHDAVLSCLRDACRRFAINTDRVFLSGHSIGGDAVWDIALAHPDLWAGVIPIVAVADRYCSHYWQNAEYVPMYVVAGELDGDKMVRNAMNLDRYLRRGFDATVVEFLGRGHEHFYDEIQRLFDWMNRRERDFFPKEFTTTTMRTWDNYFWWLEMSGFPERSTVDPSNWPPPRGTRGSIVSGKINQSSIIVKTGAERVSVWLTPKLIDLESRFTLSVNGRRVMGGAGQIQPDLEILLEDVRTRGDRLQPFWARVDVP